MHSSTWGPVEATSYGVDDADMGANGGFMGQLYALGCWCMMHGGCWRLCGSFIGAMGAVKGQDETVRG